MLMDKHGKWLLCPICHSKTRVWIYGSAISFI